MKGHLHGTVTRLRSLLDSKVAVLFTLDSLEGNQEQSFEFAMPADAAKAVHVGERFTITIESENE